MNNATPNVQAARASVKRLPYTPPAVTSYPRHAFALAALAGHPSHDAWLYGNHIQLYCNTDRELDKDWFDYFVLEPLHHYNAMTDCASNRVTRDFIRTIGKPISEIVADAIEQDFYILIHVDEYDIPCARFYKQKHHHHGVMLFGFDRDKRLFNILGYYEDQRLSERTITFDDLDRAYASAGKWAEDAIEGHEHFYPVDYMKVMHLLKGAPDGRYTFRIDSVTEQLEDYLYSRNTNERYKLIEERFKGVYGLAVYGYLANMLKRMLEAPPADRPTLMDHRPMYILMEHKRVMNGRLAYMLEHGHVRDIGNVQTLYREIEGMLMLVLNQFGKFVMKEFTDDAYILRIIELLDQIAAKERTAIELLLEEMRRTSAATA